MNGKKKFHKPNGPAFDAGQEWRGCDGSAKVEIISVRKFGEGKFDSEITYLQSDGSVAKKDAWNFQVRYYHVADRALMKEIDRECAE